VRWIYVGYKAKATAINGFSCNTADEGNATQYNAHSHKIVDEPAIKRERERVRELTPSVQVPQMPHV